MMLLGQLDRQGLLVDDKRIKNPGTSNVSCQSGRCVFSAGIIRCVHHPTKPLWSSELHVV